MTMIGSLDEDRVDAAPPSPLDDQVDAAPFPSDESIEYVPRDDCGGPRNDDGDGGGGRDDVYRSWTLGMKQPPALFDVSMYDMYMA